MDISSVAEVASAHAVSQVQQQASLLVLKKAMQMQESAALQLLQALPAPSSFNGGTAGGIIDTFA